MTKIAEYMFDRALISLQQKRHEEASEILADVLKADPAHARAWCIRGDLEHQAGRSFNALLHMNAAIQFAPYMHEAWCNRGLIAAWIGCVGIAEDSYMESLRIQNNIESHINLGNLYTQLMRIDEAAEHFRLALLINSEDPQSLTNIGMCLYSKRDWANGFRFYRYRFRNPHFQPRPQIHLPVWQGEDIKGKAVLVFGEQGYGDEILAFRFCETLKNLGARVLLSARPPVYRLARTVKAADAVIYMYDEPPEQCDYCCALLDAPGWAGMSPETVPGAKGYLGPLPDKRILDLPEGFRVGICWESGKRPLQPHLVPVQKAKSIPLEYLSFLQQEGVILVSLQSLDMSPGNTAALKNKFGVIDPMPGVQDFADTAWIISQLDLVITVDTAVAHLAGALGKPVWNLVRFDAIWPWMNDNRETCWYDSMRIYRQIKTHDWVDPIRRLKDDFEALVEERCVAEAAE